MTRAAAPTWRHLGKVRAAAIVLSLPILAHLAVVVATQMTPPAISAPAVTVTPDGERLEAGRSYLRMRGGVREVRLVGSPTEIGAAHVALLYPDLLAIEGQLHDQFEEFVPIAPARWLIMDLARLRFRHLESALAAEHRHEIAAFALGFEPDPFESLMPTYQRFVFLNSLYDIMLSFEHSPLVGCSSFVLHGAASEGGHTLMGRNFDMEGPHALDERKAVFLVHEQDRIPYASVSWPGFVGAVTAMNAEGVAVVLHGARAREPDPSGQPVAQTMRELLGRAHTTREALALLAGKGAMVPHLLVLADASGDAVVVERAPGVEPFVRGSAGDRLAVTNHFEGPLASDPHNQEVMRLSSTVSRRTRLDALLADARAVTPAAAVAVLRDRRGANGEERPLGDRSTLDALIATHSVVMDATARVLWVSEGPHTLGRYVRFDLEELLAPGYEPSDELAVEALPEDEIVRDGRFEAWVSAGSPRGGAE